MKANLHWVWLGSPQQETEFVLPKDLSLGLKALWVNLRWVRWERKQQETESFALMVVVYLSVMTAFWW
jgi:hypothetical protein